MYILGYDTLWASRPEWELTAAEWGPEEIGTYQTGYKYDWRKRIEPVTIGFTQRGHMEAGIPREPMASYLWVQASLPKVLRGHNAWHLHDPEEISAAVDKVSAIVSEFLGRDEDLRGWVVNRLDVTADHLLESEMEVERVLTALAWREMRNRLPVRGADRSVTWTFKDFTYQAYSKWKESDMEEAQGRLRLEVRAKHKSALKRMVADGTLVRAIRVGDIHTSEVMLKREAMVSPLVDLVNMCMQDAPSDLLAFVEKTQAEDINWGKATRLLGASILVANFGWGIVEKYGATRQTGYNLRKEFKKLGIRPEEIRFT